MSSTLQIETSTKAGKVPVAVVAVKGELDAQTHEALEKTAAEQIKGGAKAMVLDLSQVKYIGSAGVRALITIAKNLQGDIAGGSKFANLKLLNPSPEVHRILKTLGFEYTIEVVTDLDKAVASF
jgi:anti-anti-sigma factor